MKIIIVNQSNDAIFVYFELFSLKYLSANQVINFLFIYERDNTIWKYRNFRFVSDETNIDLIFRFYIY